MQSSAFTKEVEVVVVGGGPAALMGARALAGQGLKVGVVSPSVGQKWENQYGIWLDEWTDSRDLLSHIWTQAVVKWPGTRKVLARAYGRIDGERWRAALGEALGGLGVVVHEDTLTSVHHEASHSVGLLGSGKEVRAKVMVDATGTVSTFLERLPSANPSEQPLYQTAYGVFATLTKPPEDPNAMLFMDWSSSEATSPGEPPSFLYAMPLDAGGTRYFLEETVLVGPRLPFDVLAARLTRRLARLNIQADIASEGVERCLIRTNLPLPNLRQRLLGFGASASLIHPATGYHLGYALALTKPWAVAITKHLRANSPPSVLCAAAWDTLWPSDARRTHALYSLGAQILAQMPLPTLQAFFTAFFHLPPEQCHHYLSRRLSPGGLMAAMLAMWRHAPPSLALTLALKTLSDPRRIASALRP